MTKYEHTITKERFVSLEDTPKIIDGKEYVEVCSFGGDETHFKLKSELILLDKEAVMPR